MARSRVSEGRRLVALDSSCMIALVWGPHEHHEATAALLEARLQYGADLAVLGPALVETYSVLTRLPSPHRLAPDDALQLITDNFRAHRTYVLDSRDYWSMLSDAPEHGVHGGRTYDAVIVACARKAGAREIVTLNLKHFHAFAADDLQVTSPVA